MVHHSARRADAKFALVWGEREDQNGLRAVPGVRSVEPDGPLSPPSFTVGDPTMAVPRG